MIIDTHAHVWSANTAAFPFQPILAHVPAPTVPAPVEQLLEDMDEAGVDVTVLVQPSVYGWDNRYLMQCLDRWPNRFAGICLVDPRKADPTDLDRWCGAGGCRGVRFNIISERDVSWLLDKTRSRLFEALEERGLSASFHMDIDQAPVVADLAARHGDAPFIVDYLGAAALRRNDLDAHIGHLAAQANILWKVLCVAEDADTAYPFPDVIAFYRKLLDRFEADRLMFGSDYPGPRSICGYENTVKWLGLFPGLDSRSYEWLMGQTAARVFGLDRGQSPNRNPASGSPA